ncbi:ASKHA domain-containing protein [Staphylothermus hellenicus]|uniref:Uncharacterized metal-binding protein-like protein n=1 Tax=Staphylothermus hellenicus (strain DSM 12710 / JCM 10830 / BK20S6-10-b1 / P8) TaxID=591019 RepID=D7DBH4_STAHD|nr:ASKHA domain-containing protein [Staphylothermus hellenicus]ADI31521.1 Uncharacterized metal-binding protein-like protein [Staphylothermus hellenicus DSM 12710]
MHRKCEEVTINVVGYGKISACKGDNLGEILASKGIMPLPCGGRGLCGLCRVKVYGETNPITGNEIVHGLSGNERLACQVIVMGDLVVEAEKPRIISVPRYSINIPLKQINPVINIVRLEKPPYINKDYVVINGLKPSNYILLEDMILSTTGDPEKILLVDLGTTKIAYQAVTMSGEVIGEKIHINPLNIYGSDIITRITHILEKPESLREMGSSLRKEVNNVAEEYNIGSIFIAGNSVMEHLYLGLPIETLAEKPFQPLFHGPFLTYTYDKPTILAPLIAGYVGGDAYSELIASLKLALKKPYMIIDLGTNTEVLLVTNDKIYATSTPAGPAFEGHLARGSTIVYGGIYKVEIIGSRNSEPVFNYKYIHKPYGLLGTGIISLVAELLRHKYIDERGRFLKGYKRINNVKTYVIDKDQQIFFTQKDLREFQKAYAAVKTAWIILCRRAGIKCEDLEHVIIAGSFGSNIESRDLIDLGLVPVVENSRLVYAGNMVLSGLKIMMLDSSMFKIYRSILEKIAHINLAEDKDYMKTWIKCLNIVSLRGSK